MPVITISRQLGSGGGVVATEVAARLGWQLLDRALVERIAEELNVAPEQVAQHDERVETFVERIGQYLSEGFPEVMPLAVLPPVSPEATARAARRVIGVLPEDRPAVVVGHGAQCILRGHEAAFHVLTHAPLPLRISRARDAFQCGEEEAERRIRQSDRDRTRYVREHFGEEWLSPALYDLCIDTGRLGVGGAVELIGRGAQRVFRAGGGLSREVF